LAACAFATLFLILTTASALAQSFGSAEEARAMLDRAVAALKSDEAKALREFNDADNKEFHDRDLYVSCFNIADGNFTAAPSAMLGTDIRTFKVGDDPIGQRAFDAVQGTPELRWTLISQRQVSPPSSSPLSLASALRAVASLTTNNCLSGAYSPLVIDSD